jgi:hypothetical protein
MTKCPVCCKELHGVRVHIERDYSYSAEVIFDGGVDEKPSLQIDHSDEEYLSCRAWGLECPHCGHSLPEEAFDGVYEGDSDNLLD